MSPLVTNGKTGTLLIAVVLALLAAIVAFGATNWDHVLTTLLKHEQRISALESLPVEEPCR